MKKKNHLVWVVYWTYVEYGGPHSTAGPTYHLTREEAYSYKQAREGEYRGYEDGYYYAGSEPSPEFVDKRTYESIKNAQTKA